MNEFLMIDDYFKHKTLKRSDVFLGIGDDAALVSPKENEMLALSIDTMVAGVHFFKNADPYDIGYKAVAVNLSDLAAMGATPAWMTLALTMPLLDPAWLESFSNGMFDLAREFNVQLIGGDSTAGPLCITVQMHGFVPKEEALKRSGAKPGDRIYVSGCLGDAALGLKVIKESSQISNNENDYLLQRLLRPKPQINLGKVLRHYASSAIDISDGMLADLEHILKASGVGAEIDVNRLPLSPILARMLSPTDAICLALTGGDDYELCFTVPCEKEADMLGALKRENMNCYLVGVIKESKEVELNGFKCDLPTKGFKHWD